MNSMTGFARSEVTIQSQLFSLEIKSVNHRFLDVRYRLPSGFSGLEMELTEEIRKFCERGSMEVTLRHQPLAEKGRISGNTRFAVDEKALESLLKATQQLENLSQKKWEIQISDLIQSQRILIPIEDSEEKSLGLKEVIPLFQSTLSLLVKMRREEGEKLKKILRDGVNEMQLTLQSITKLSPLQKEKIKDRLETRLSQWKLAEPVEPRRLEWEVAILAEKSDITEEIDRLKSHFEAFLESLNSSKPIGRKLDFLAQELNREVNTIASKTSLMEITQLTVELKATIEKLREQVQNVE